MDVEIKLKDALYDIIGSAKKPVEDPPHEDAYYGGVLVDTPTGPKVAYLRLTFEEPPFSTERTEP